MDYKVKIGLAPTRRSIFSVEDALKYKRLIEEKLTRMGVEYIPGLTPDLFDPIQDKVEAWHRGE